MRDLACLSFIVDRFEQRTQAVAVRLPGCESRIVSLEEVRDLDAVFLTHDLPLLLQVFRRSGAVPPKAMVDVREALKVRSQLARDDGGEKEWAVWRAARPFFQNPADAQRIESLMNAETAPPEREELERIVIEASHALSALWQQVCDDLEEKGEFERFSEIEIPVQELFNFRGIAGIAIDRDATSKFIKACENEKFSLFRRISLLLGRTPLGISDQRLASELLRLERSEVGLGNDDRGVEDLLNVLSFRSKSASILLDYIKAKRDLAVLREVTFAPGRVYPVFHVHGTVTSRVLVSDPRLQQLRKRYRSILAADHGKELTYLDYAQFEPGILSVLSNDAGLVMAYKDSDMYASLATAAFGDEQSRDFAKRIFLAHLYGMSVERISSLLSGMEEESAERIRTFFGQFPGVEEFRLQTQEELRTSGRVGSVFGNLRRRRGSGALSPKETRWAMNHKIQASASLIFKRALIGIARRFGPDSVLLPMHDAVLLQFDPAVLQRADFESDCVGIMQDAFQTYCPGVEPKVTSAPFAPTTEHHG
jgi:DNA polymerase I